MSEEIEDDVAATAEDVSDSADELEAVPAKKKLSGKTLVLFVILPALVLILGGGGVSMMLLGGGKADAMPADSGTTPPVDEHGKADSHEKKDSHGKKEEHAAPAEEGHGAESSVHSASALDDNGAVIQIGEPGSPSFYTMPKIIVTVSSGSGRRSQLLLKLTLEANDPGVFDRVDAHLPRITDQFQMFLREMRIDDLSGSAGDYRIRRELLRRVNMSLYPQSIDAVLIEEFIVQ